MSTRQTFFVASSRWSSFITFPRSATLCVVQSHFTESPTHRLFRCFDLCPCPAARPICLNKHRDPDLLVAGLQHSKICRLLYPSRFLPRLYRNASASIHTQSTVHVRSTHTVSGVTVCGEGQRSSWMILPRRLFSHLS